ncbi:MAG: dihydroorotase multifunctional complex type [Elusimicrobia bacterium]|nr:MAG: dihydroorotase multifunctional complex type [Elusimicrobiota bacterium]KAF0154637.1 MAG: dihydroorotase multifunctional complex type [Elusimicrobiota bacterium]
MKKLLIRRALAVDPALGPEKVRDLLAENGRITRISAGITPPRGCAVVDARGKWLFPGFIDAHAHAREPGGEKAEDFRSFGLAAAAGGVTTALAMPNTTPPCDDPSLLKKLRARALKKCAVNLLFAAALTKGRAGRALTSMEELAAAGAAAFTDDGGWLAGRRLLEEALRRAWDMDLPVLQHSEDFRLTGPGVINLGPVSRRLGLPGISRAAETSAVRADLASLRRAGAGRLSPQSVPGALRRAGAGRLSPQSVPGALRRAGGRLHLQHLSCAGSVELVRRARAAGLPVTAETCPHYIALTEADVVSGGTDMKMKPPLRAEADRRALIKGLADGTVDMIATDHAPHPAAEKAKGLLRAPFGVTGLETMAGVCLTHLVFAGHLDRLRLAELLSLNPARLLGLHLKGSLAPGMDADLTLIDPSAEYEVQPPFFSKSSNSPFKGRRLRGAAWMTVVGGDIVFRRRG